MACLQQFLAGSSYTRQHVESTELIIYSSLNRVITEALNNRIGKSWLYYN